MNKKHIIIVLLVIMAVLMLPNLFKYIILRLEISKNECILLDYYNLKKNEGMTDKSLTDIDFYNSDLLQDYNITDLINYYLYQLEQVNNNLRDEKDTNKQLYVNDNHYYNQYSKNYSGYILRDKIDIKSVKDLLTEILVYKNGLYYLPIDSSSRIELPFSYYIDYKRINLVRMNRIKEVQKVRIIDNFVLENLENDKSKTYNIDIVYIDNNNKIQNEQGVATYNYDTKLWSSSLYNIYYSFDKAHITLCNHQYDKEKEEAEKRLNEVDALVFESNQELMEQMEEEETGIHHEKTYVFKERGLIWLSHNKKEDIWYYEFSPLVPKKEKKEDIEYLNGFMTGEEDITLPYTEEMTIDEVKEKFYKDKESIKKSLAIWDIDAEEFLNNEDITDEMLDDYVEKQFDLMGYEKKQ